MAKQRPLRDIRDDECLTQYGEAIPDESGYNFRNRLREHQGENELSLIAGRLTPQEAAKVVTKVGNPQAAARYTTAGELRTQGFIVRHSPTRKNARHVSVHPPQAGGQPAAWDDDMTKRFDECFTTPNGGDETDGRTS